MNVDGWGLGGVWVNGDDGDNIIYNIRYTTYSVRTNKQLLHLWCFSTSSFQFPFYLRGFEMFCEVPKAILE